MFRGKGWFAGGMWKPKNPHSLEYLKYLYHVLYKNQVVNEQNKSLLVETLRSIAEILIWGDQNDSTVFDFFLEKNMLSFFLKIMKQKCGRYVCIQLLQTLNILFENIRNETSLYYLLSNNHVNSIIMHKFDFSDEEVMAYYISFLKTLSLKLNTHTIHFFYNEHTNDFPLYNEAIKFFKHGESMVRIAVRTLTLNVFRVDDKAMLKFIRDKSASPYFSNLVWFIGEHIMELDKCVVSSSGLQAQTRLADLVAEHLDHLHYLNDILCLNIEDLNDVLTDHLLNKLLVPLYVRSLVQGHLMDSLSVHPSGSSKPEERPLVSLIVSLFLLSQVFLIVSHQPLVKQLANIILNGDSSVFTQSLPALRADDCLLEASISAEPNSLCRNSEESSRESASHEGPNITDEEKAVAAKKFANPEAQQRSFSLANRPFLEAIFSALDCSENDHAALFALCVLYALGCNSGINQGLLDSVFMTSDKSETKFCYNINLADRMIQIISLSSQYCSKVRIATLQMTILLLKQLSLKGTVSYLLDRHLAAIEQCREESTVTLRNFYKSEEIFLDMFEDEYEEMRKKSLNVEYLMMDSNLLLPPSGTPLTGIEFHKRLPCGEVERARRAIRVFFLLRDLSLMLQNEAETQLPLTNLASCIKVNDALDLTNSDMISCTVITKDSQKIKGFMVIDALQLILVDPDNKRVGWGIAKFVGFLQDIEVTGDKEDSRCLHITIHRPSSVGKSPLLSARFVFDDHIRCMAAKQRLSKGRQKARQSKLHQVARLLELPDHIQPCPSPLRRGLKSADYASLLPRSQSQDTGLRGRAPRNRAMLPPLSRVPGHAIKRDSHPAADTSPRRSSSPQQHASEEIPLENLAMHYRSPNIRCKSASGLPQARISAPPGMGHSHLQCTTSTKSSNEELFDADSIHPLQDTLPNSEELSELETKTKGSVETI